METVRTLLVTEPIEGDAAVLAYPEELGGTRTPAAAQPAGRVFSG
jgi:hypothetical protein